MADRLQARVVGGGPASVPPPAREPAAAEVRLYRRLTYLTAFRIVIISALLGATTWVSVKPDEELGGPLSALLYGVSSFVYAASLAYLWLLRRRRQLKALAYAQVAGDLLVATFLVYLTGGADSIFTLMYPLAIVNASVLLDRGGALVSAVGGAIVFGVLALSLEAGLVPPAAPYLAQRALTTSRLAFIIIANGSAFLLTAALASYLTEQLRTTGESLREREVDYAALAELHGAIVRSMSAGIVTTDVAGRVTFMNPAAEAITGLTFTGLIDEPLRQWFPALAAAVEAVLARGLNRGEVDERDARGELRRLVFVVNPMTRVGAPRRRGRLAQPGLAIVFEDLTALRDMQEEVRRSDRLAAVGQLSAGLAHELRNPLASMTGSIELLGRGGSLTDAEHRLLAIVLREAERLNALVTDFLAFARPLPTTSDPADVAAIADETMGVFRHSPLAAGLLLERTGVPSARLFGDPAQLRQVLWNLLQNAAEATGGTGRVTVDVGWTPAGLCSVAVTDSGPGIAAEDLAHLFVPFFTTKPQGTGLGLAIVHRIVEAHGGRVEVASAPGQTTLKVLLPAGHDGRADEAEDTRLAS